ncbi:MAG: protein kinase [Deltaproteobacteria bacterium]|nr:protein kinase [Deltaproteobacteria bacterium]
MSIRLGPFDIHAPIGRGGMGEVWRGEHRAQKVPVAVKVITGERAQVPFYLAAFRNEVRAMAGLDHPSIVVVFDHGRVTDEAEQASSGALRAGSPYLVMEHCAGGSLAQQVGRLSWGAHRLTLLCILDALAHAHARGVVHRDLKPGNVLLGGSSFAVKLSDFGLAHALGEESPDRHEARAYGTPSYMAPEQLAGRFRDYGPWTDLYSLGCLGWELATGEPPLGRGSLDAIRRAHVHSPVPPLRPRMAVPAGLEAWLGRLLEKDPLVRFRRAADAALALLELGEPVPPAEAPAEVPSDEVDSSRSTVALPIDGVSIDALRSGPTHPAVRIPPVPGSWHSEAHDGPGAQLDLTGVGLGLWGLRSIPLVGREAERDALWDELEQTARTARVRTVLLRGPAGVGKSRLAEWLCQRAHEVGAASVLKAVHGPGGGPADGLGPALSRHLGCAGLPRGDVQARIEEVMGAQGIADADEHAALTELIAPGTQAERAVRFASPLERHLVVGRALGRIGTERPVVFWLDDVQWGLDTLSFVSLLFGARSPILILMTARDEALAEREAESRALEELAAKASTRMIDVGPLPEDSRLGLVRRLLGLDRELARAVVDRTAGNPLFAVQLVGDWVHRGLLELGEDGFALRAGVGVPHLPDDLHEVWANRIGRVLEDRPATDGAALELAALLGREVDGAEWRDACARMGFEPPDGLVDALLSQRLAVRGVVSGSEGWSFVHGMLRESLERRARESDRWPGLHRACASMLHGRTGPAVAERLGRHLMAAGDAALALEPLLEGANERMSAGDAEDVEALVAERERGMDVLDLPAADSRRGQGWVLASRALRFRGETEAAWQSAARAESDARRFRWSDVLPAALLELAAIARSRGDLSGSEARCREAAALAADLGDRKLAVRCAIALAWVLLQRGGLAEAEERLRAALADAVPMGALESEAECHLRLGDLSVKAGRLADAKAHLELARERFSTCGGRWGFAVATSDLAEVARLEGDLEAAEAGYRAALDRFRALGSASASIPELNLALVLVQRGRWDETGVLLPELLAKLERENRGLLVGVLHACLTAHAAATRDWPAWDRHLEACRRIFDQTGAFDVDIAQVAAIAGDLAAAAGEAARAADARSLARRHFTGLGRTDDAKRLETAPRPRRDA